MAIITLAIVKAELGISDTTYDTAITNALPKVDAIVKDYTGMRFNDAFVGTTTDGSATVTVTSLENTYFRSETTSFTRLTSVVSYRRTSSYLSDYFKSGDYITGTGIASGSYIIDVDDLDRTITLSANATATGTVTLTRGFNLMYNYAVSQLVWFFVSNSTTTAATSNSSTIRSKSQGSTSITYADRDVVLDKKYGVPVNLLTMLPQYIKMQ